MAKKSRTPRPRARAVPEPPPAPRTGAALDVFSEILAGESDSPLIAILKAAVYGAALGLAADSFAQARSARTHTRETKRRDEAWPFFTTAEPAPPPRTRPHHSPPRPAIVLPPPPTAEEEAAAELLGLVLGASEEEIRATFRRRVKAEMAGGAFHDQGGAPEETVRLVAAKNLLIEQAKLKPS